MAAHALPGFQIQGAAEFDEVRALEFREIRLVILQGVPVGREGVSAMAPVEECVGGIFEAAIEIITAGRAEYRAGDRTTAGCHAGWGQSPVAPQ